MMGKAEGKKEEGGMSLPSCHKHNSEKASLFASSPLLSFACFTQSWHPAGGPNDMEQDGWWCS
jgi:hypothetical protein